MSSIKKGTVFRLQWVFENICVFRSSLKTCVLVLPEERDKELNQIHEVTVLRESDLRRKEKCMLNNEKNITFTCIYMCFSVCLNRTWEQRCRFWLYQYCPLLLYVSLYPHTHTHSIEKSYFSFILIQISNHIILAQLCYDEPPMTGRDE